MATLDDKLLGEKLQYYCSSDEDQDGDSDDNDEFDDALSTPSVPEPIPEEIRMSGKSSNTGPKGVITDWQRYKQLETEKRAENEREKIALAQKFSITCGSHPDEPNDDPELAELLSDQFLLEFAQKRMQELYSKSVANKTFGKLVHLKTGEEFLDAIDKEIKTITVIVHVFENNNSCCRVMNECFEELSKTYQYIKFCRISASTAGMSRSFKTEGVPAIQVYRGGNLIDSFIQLGEEFGMEYTANDVENFLLEKGVALNYQLE